MRVDFYQLGAAPVEKVVAGIAARILEKGERLLVLAGGKAFLSRLDRMLWDQEAASFLPHAMAGGSEDSRQPILLSDSPDPANRARNLLIADGQWRESALAFNRTFYLFYPETVESARTAWRGLADRSDVERHYWANENGRWSEKAADSRQSA